MFNSPDKHQLLCVPPTLPSVIPVCLKNLGLQIVEDALITPRWKTIQAAPTFLLLLVHALLRFFTVSDVTFLLSALLVCLYGESPPPRLLCDFSCFSLFSDLYFDGLALRDDWTGSTPPVPHSFTTSTFPPSRSEVLILCEDPSLFPPLNRRGYPPPPFPLFCQRTPEVVQEEGHCRLTGLSPPEDFGAHC